MRQLLAMLSIIVCAGQASAAVDPAAAVDRIYLEYRDQVTITTDQDTGVIRHLRLGSLPADAAKTSSALPQLVIDHGPAFGLINPANELRLVGRFEDRFGWSHRTYEQTIDGIPVLGARLRTHSDTEDRLYAVTAGLLPFPSLQTTGATVPAAEAERTARIFAEAENPTALVSIEARRLVVVRSGWLRGRHDGRDHLAWEVAVVLNNVHIEDIYVDSTRGTLVERVPRVADINRVIHHETYPNQVWQEGDERPFSGLGAATDAEVETLIDTSADVYELYENLSAGTFRSWNGADAVMHNTVAYQGDDLACPNAQWTGSYTRYCEGLATDDVAAHEWSHAFTQSTHGLIYMWQSGALNESYSDIFGEVVDLTNDIGFDDPSGVRTPGVCSAFAGGETSMTVLEPSELAGDYIVGRAKFNPLPPWSMEGLVELADDGVGDPHDGCTDLVGFTPGNIALFEFGSCLFFDPVSHAEAAGAAGAIIINTATDAILDMPGGGGERLGIPSVVVRKSDGAAFKPAAEAGTLRVKVISAEGSTRWLMGEDSSLGVLRDMWVPACAGDPGSVDDELYFCDSDTDGGGVHTNSGVPNRVFTQLVDGGRVDGEPVPGIGLTRAAHLYWRAMSVYQTPISSFKDHAEALEASCTDLMGAPLTDLLTGEASEEVITAEDCETLRSAIDAGALRDDVPCRFHTLLRPDAPALNRQMTLLDETFSQAAPEGWEFADQGVYDEYDPRSWTWTEAPPEGGDGAAMFAASDPTIGNCAPGSDDQSGVVFLTTPEVVIPTGAIAPMLQVDHYVATSTQRFGDGGNIKIAVNGSDFELLPTSAFRFNPYTRELRSAQDGSSNPLAGQPVFAGYNEGFFEGSWGQSQVDLSGFATSGDTIRIRFDFGTDGCLGLDGWYLDRVRVVAAPTAREAPDRLP